MQSYVISKEAREIFATDIDRVKAAIATIANERFGQCEIRGILKSGGGVSVNDRDIAIKSDCVVDDFGVRGNVQATPEEQAVVDAILAVEQDVLENGIECISKYRPCLFGDPLSNLVGE